MDTNFPYRALIDRTDPVDRYSPEIDPATGNWPLRDGTNSIERMAAHRVIENISALPASMVVQLLLWPAKLATFADRIGRSSAMVYNTLNKSVGRPYRPVRRSLATRLDVPLEAINHLIDATPAPPSSLIPTTPEPTWKPEAPQRPAFDFSMPPAVRDGTNPLECHAILAFLANLPSLDASTVVQFALWPANLNQFAAALKRDPGHLYHMLHYRHGLTYARDRRSLARALAVSVPALAQLIEAPRREISPRPLKPSQEATAAIARVQALVANERSRGPIRKTDRPRDSSAPSQFTLQMG